MRVATAAKSGEYAPGPGGSDARSDKDDDQIECVSSPCSLPTSVEASSCCCASRAISSRINANSEECMPRKPGALVLAIASSLSSLGQTCANHRLISSGRRVLGIVSGRIVVLFEDARFERKRSVGKTSSGPSCVLLARFGNLDPTPNVQRPASCLATFSRVALGATAGFGHGIEGTGTARQERPGNSSSAGTKDGPSFAVVLKAE
mmetsp:Transcript_28457/g.71492  ORF Transcript_28457/g.71492 Transcript_28457/m.71492 type:complete len:206 (-) Transcript_28457:25-642(-)